MANPDAIVLASNFWDISRLWQLDPAWMRDTPVFPQDLMASWRANFTTIAQKFKAGSPALHLFSWWFPTPQPKGPSKPIGKSRMCASMYCEFAIILVSGVR